MKTGKEAEVDRTFKHCCIANGAQSAEDDCCLENGNPEGCWIANRPAVKEDCEYWVEKEGE